MLTSTYLHARALARSILVSLSVVSSLSADVVLHYSFDANYEDSSANENYGIPYDENGDSSILIDAGAAVFGDGGMVQGEMNDRVDLTTPFTPDDGTPWTIAFWADLSGGAAAYGFNSNNEDAIRARADALQTVTIYVDAQEFSFQSIGIIVQNSVDNHYVIVANPVGIDLDGVAGDDKFAVYANGQLLTPESGQNLTDRSVSTAIEVTMLGDSGRWPYGATGDYDEFWILDEALSANGVQTLHTKNYPHELWYVNVNTLAVEGDQDGWSWETAYADLQDALSVAGEGAMIWVANGIYRPVLPVDPTNPTVAEQAVSFQLKTGQMLYGGFKGNETSMEIPFNPGNVKLSGDIGNDDISASNGYADLDIGFQGKNSLHVLSVIDAVDCVINGFTIIEGGDALTSDTFDRVGGGIFVNDSGSITIENCEFEHNYSRNGSALYVKNTAVSLIGCEFEGNRATNSGAAVMVNHSIDDGKPVFEAIDCSFRDNQADVRGGALNTTYADLRFYNSKFTANSAPSGGAIDVYRTSGHFVNCLLVENTASGNGGAVAHRSGGSLSHVNATFYGNITSGEGHHVYVESSAGQSFVNSILWHGATVPEAGSAFYKPSGTATYEHCLVQAVDLTGVGTGNLEGSLAVNDPEFTDPSDAEYGVRAYSPLVNAGVTVPSESGNYDTPDVDGDGDLNEIYPADLYDKDDARVVGQSIDIGAFEHQSPFELKALNFGYEDFGSGGPARRVSLSDALDSEDDSASVSVTNSDVVDVFLEEDQIQLTVKDYGAVDVVIDFQYKGGAVHQYRVPVLVRPEPLESRDLSALVNVDYTAADFGQSQDYADLSTIFPDGPVSFSVVSANTSVFTVSLANGDVGLVPVGFGQADLTLRAHYSDGTVLEIVRTVTVSLATASQAAVDAAVATVYGINGNASTFTFADLSVALTEGVMGITVSSSDEEVYTVGESDGVVTVSLVGVGSSEIEIELEFAGGEIYTIQETLRVFDYDGQLLAQYLLDGDANDVQGVHHASASAAGVTWSPEDVTIGELGAFSAPNALTEDLFLIDDSFELNFSFKVQTAEENGVKMLAAIKEGGSGFYQVAGVMLAYLADNNDDGRVDIVLNYTDGLSSDHYHSKTIAQCELGQWYTVQLVFDFDLGIWTCGIGDEYSIGVINNKSDYDYDFESLKNTIRTNNLLLGAFDRRQAQDIAEESEVSLDEVLIYSPKQALYPAVVTALDAFAEHIDGVRILTEQEQADFYTVLERDLHLSEVAKVTTATLNLIQTYADNRSPVFESSDKVDPTTLPMETQALILVQQWVHQTLYAPETLDQVSHLIFEDAAVFPGAVGASEPRIASATVLADADYATDPDADYIWAERVLRPLGYYAPAGEVVTVSVDPAYTNLGLRLVVGAHVRDLDPHKKPNINRFRDIAHEYELDASTIEVANGFGGGLYLSVPDGTSAGDISLTIQNAVKAPYFSARAGKETDVATWLAEVAASEVPWVDFESDKFMFTVPLSFAQSVAQPDLIMDRWDEIMDQYRFMNGRPLEGRIRAEYFLLDRMLVTPAWGAGYPMVVPVSSAEGAASNWNPLNALTIAPNSTLFHELGHNCAIPGPVFEGEERELDSGEIITLKSWAEGENLVNLPAVVVYSRVYNMDLDTAFSQATHQPLTINQAALDWLVTENFRAGRPISHDTSGVFELNPNAMGELHYQARGIGRYGELVRLFGWDALNAIQSEFYPIRDEDSFQPDGKRHRLYRDALIRRASEVMGLNMAPMFHLWGIHPSDSLKAELTTMPKSWAVKNQLEAYLDLVPSTRADYDLLHSELVPLVGGYQEARYNYYAGYFSDADADAIGTQIENIIFDYGLDVTGDEPYDLAVRMRPDGRLHVSWRSDADGEAGFVVRAQAPDELTATEVGRASSNGRFAVTSLMAAGAYTFTVAVVYRDGTESLPGKLTVSSVPSAEAALVELDHQLYDGVSFSEGNLTTEFLPGSSTGGSGGSLQVNHGSRLMVTAADLLQAMRNESGDDSLGYDSVQIQSLTLRLPDGFNAGPSVVEIQSDAVPGYDAYAGGVNTSGNVLSFSFNDQQLDLSSLYSMAEGKDFDFFLYNPSPNGDFDDESAYLEIEYEVIDGYREWYETNGLTLYVDASGLDDPDGDGVLNLMEFALGLDPSARNASPTHQLQSSELADHMQMRFQRERADVRYWIEATVDLSDWSAATVVWDSEVDLADLVDPGQEQAVDLSTNAGNARFYRLRVDTEFLAGFAP